MNMYHMGFHLEAQRQQRTIDKKKAAEEKTGPSQVRSRFVAGSIVVPLLSGPNRNCVLEPSL